ncbi:MAG: hypothetical protein PVF14_18050 [Desulfobacterales bacterium]
MKEIQTLLKIMSDGLKTLAHGVEALAERVDEAATPQGKVQPTKKQPAAAASKRKASKKPVKKTTTKTRVKKMTAADSVLKIISKSKKGVSTAAIIEQTGYNQKKVANIIYRLKNQGKIKTIQKGIYVKS